MRPAMRFPWLPDARPDPCLHPTRADSPESATPCEVPASPAFRFFGPGYPALGYADGDTANVLDISGNNLPLDTLSTGGNRPVFRPASSAGFACLEFPAYAGMADASALRTGAVAASFGLVMRFTDASNGYAQFSLVGASGTVMAQMISGGWSSILVNSQTTGWSASAPSGADGFGTDWLTLVAVIAATRADSFVLVNGTRIDSAWTWSGDEATLAAESRTLTLGTGGMPQVLYVAEAVTWDRALSSAEAAALATAWVGYEGG